jgi:hypothetical protein
VVLLIAGVVLIIIGVVPEYCVQGASNAALWGAIGETAAWVGAELREATPLSYSGPVFEASRKRLARTCRNCFQIVKWNRD